MAIWGNAARIHRSLSSGSCESWVTKWRTRSGGPKRVKTPGGPTRNRVLRGMELYTIGQYWTIYILYNYIQYIIYNYIQLDNIGYVTYVYICHQRPNDTLWCVWKLSIPPEIPMLKGKMVTNQPDLGHRLSSMLMAVPWFGRRLICSEIP